LNIANKIAAVRQEWWVFPNGKVIDVPETHGQTAVEILEERGVEIPEREDGSGVPDFMKAMEVLFKEGAARVHRYGKDVVVSVNKFTSKILDAITELFIDKNVPLENNIVLQYGGVGAFTNMEVSFEDLLKVGNDPRKLEKMGKTNKYGSKLLLNPEDIRMMRIANKVAEKFSL
jgi:hypothetical protein